MLTGPGRRTVLGLGLLLILLSGCGRAIVGKWDMVSAKPNREFLAIDDATFGSDGRYEATVTLDGHTARQAGHYTFDGFKLMLRPDDGGQKRFDALLKMNTLELTRDQRQVILQRAGK